MKEDDTQAFGFQEKNSSLLEFASKTATDKFTLHRNLVKSGFEGREKNSFEDTVLLFRISGVAFQKILHLRKKARGRSF